MLCLEKVIYIRVVHHLQFQILKLFNLSICQLHALGLDYLADQLAYFNGDVYAALAAYNGGPGNAATWLSLANGDPDLFVEVIRFDETRNYVMGIYEVFSIYQRVYERVP